MSKEFEKSIFWFRRDLRLEDNRGVFQALQKSKKVFFIFIFDSKILDKLSKSDRRITLIYSLIESLREQLREFGSNLLVLQGDPVKVIPEISKKLKINCLFTNRDYESYAKERDQQVSDLLKKEAIEFKTFKDQIIFENQEVLKPDHNFYTVFTPYKKRFLATLKEQESETLADFTQATFALLRENQEESEEILSIKQFEELGFQKDEQLEQFLLQNKPEAVLKNFLATRISQYKEKRDFMYPGETSQISMFLRFGAISIRKCFREAFKLLAEEESSPGIETWISELIWREFYSMILQSFPQVEFEAFQVKYRDLAWVFDQNLWEAWQNAQTGYPIVDAATKELKETGFMHNRARMISASFLTKDLLHSWQLGEKFFAEYLLDFELASNNGGWQWAASVGTDAAPYFRIFNPILQSKKFDPEALYIKKYLPELRDIKPEKIHNLDFTCANYPRPIVDHQEAKQKAIQLFKAI